MRLPRLLRHRRLPTNRASGLPKVPLRRSSVGALGETVLREGPLGQNRFAPRGPKTSRATPRAHRAKTSMARGPLGPIPVGRQRADDGGSAGDASRGAQYVGGGAVDSRQTAGQPAAGDLVCERRFAGASRAADDDQRGPLEAIRHSFGTCLTLPLTSAWPSGG